MLSNSHPWKLKPLKDRLSENEVMVRREKWERRHWRHGGFCAECGMLVAPEARATHPCWQETLP